MWRVLALSGVVLVLASTMATGQESLLPAGAVLHSEKDLEALSEKSLEHLMRGEIEGFEQLQAHAVDIGDKESANRFFRSAADRLKGFGRKWGKPLGYERIARRKVGDSLCQYIYLAKYENNVMRWVFTYYRPKDAWLFFRVDFDDNINALFEDAGESNATPQASPGTAKP